MPIELVTGPANAGKAQVVLDALRSLLAREREPLLVVPTSADEARYRRELAESAVTLGVRVERFDDLFETVLQRAGARQALLGGFAREQALLQIAAEAFELGDGALRGTARALGELIAELEVARVEPARLRALAAASDAPLAGQLSCAFDAYRALLQRSGLFDWELCVTRALDVLRRAPARWGDVPVLLYGFDSFTELELDAIETLGHVLDAPVTVSLTYEPGRLALSGRAEAFERLRPLARSHVELAAREDYYAPASRVALHHLERSLFESGASRVAAGDALSLLEGGSPRAELELVAGEVRALLDDGMEPEEIAIVHRAPDAIARLLAETLEDFDIVHSVRPQLCFGQSAVGRALVGLMRCAAGTGSLSDLLAWLRAPGVLERVELADRLEARALRRGIAAAAPARELWEAEHWPLDRIDRLSSAAGADHVKLLELLLAELERLFCAPRRRRALLLVAHELQEARALKAARAALGELRVFAGVTGALAVRLDELAEALEHLPVPEQAGAARTGVRLSSPLSLRARRVKVLFLCGLQDGVFPALAQRTGLLGEQERRELALSGGLVLAPARDAQAAERYLLYALCSRPEQRLVLSWHTAGEDGTPCARSLFVDDICDLFEDSLALRGRSAGDPAWPGPGAPAGRAGARSAAAASEGKAVEAAIAPLRDPTVLGELGSQRLWSASALEAYSACPVRWLVERVLRADAMEPDSEPLARGGLAHAVLRDTFERLRAEAGSARLSPTNLPIARRLMEQALEQHAPLHLQVLPFEQRAPVRRGLQADLAGYLEHAALTAAEASELEPAHTELQFGFGGQEDDLPALELGEEVLVRGRIDRVDLSPGGEAVVYDYKGRSATPGARWAQDGALQVALYMLAVEELLHRRAAGGFYQPLAGKDLRARGLLDTDSSVVLDSVRTDRRTRPEIEEALSECRQAALSAVARARAGELEPRPRSCAHGGGCMYPEICRC